ncbi:heparin lyase I family protein [Halochromatium roseum]|uniref:heparin lyase I family protein n=1 Tax=Halochromatium roseum TaxID=391920 RepID=UPI001913952A|nr:heparin lyase I family protein [Halochromatium roseum]
MSYEDGKENLPGLGVMAKSPSAADAISINCDDGRRGECSLISLVASGQEYRSFGASRAESNAMDNYRARYHQGARFFYRLSFKLPDESLLRKQNASDYKAIEIIWQAKRFNGPPDIFLGIKASALVLRVTDRLQRTLIPSPVPVDQWIDVEIAAAWSTGEDGELYAQASLVGGASWPLVEVHGPNMRDAEPLSGYLKWGLYRPDVSGAFPAGSIKHDRIEIYLLPEGLAEMGSGNAER